MARVIMLHNSTSIVSLDTEHQESFRRAISNLFATDLAERAYAQILDGLPTQQSLRDSYFWIEGHPVYEIPHKEICKGFIEKAREFRATFDPSSLEFKPSLLKAYSKTQPGSKHFQLRLIELVAVACHQVAAHLYEFDNGAHKHQLYEEWRDAELQKVRVDNPGHYVPPAAFFQRAYQWAENYPRGVSDVVGYWAEGKIFGGVLVFDRGVSEKECNALWIHGDLIRGPQTLYPPTQEQFDALISFLLEGPDNICPLPIHGTKANRPRWHAYDALSKFHIFRDKFALKPPIPNPRGHRVFTPVDWPETGDEWFLVAQCQAQYRGEPIDEEKVTEARARINEVTPTSPCWVPRTPGRADL